MRRILVRLPVPLVIMPRFFLALFFHSHVMSNHAARDSAKDGMVVRQVAGNSADGGALPRLARPVRWYAGVIPGTGNHWLSWIHIDDLIRLLLSALENGRYAGAINATAPEPVRYDDFYSLLAHSLHRPIWMHVPASVVKAGLGEMSQLLLTGQRVLPRRAQELGFEFRYATAAGALRAIYGH